MACISAIRLCLICASSSESPISLNSEIETWFRNHLHLLHTPILGWDWIFLTTTSCHIFITPFKMVNVWLAEMWESQNTDNYLTYGHVIYQWREDYALFEESVANTDDVALRRKFPSSSFPSPASDKPVKYRRSNIIKSHIRMSYQNCCCKHYRVEFVDKLVQVIGRLHDWPQQSHKSHIVALQIQLDCGHL